MRAEELLKEGDLAGCLSTLQDHIRSNPADSEGRVFLFQLLAVLGDWDRALNQLNVAGELDSQTLPMVQAYREVLRCEALRDRVFAGDRQPTVFGEPERWIALVLEAVRVSARGDHGQANELRAQAYEDAPETSGNINGEPFEWITDGDTRIGPFFEALVNGGYYWVPLHRIQKVEIEAPQDLRDLVWAPATFTWANGGKAIGFIPSRYPETTGCADPAFLLCKRTEWVEQADDTYFGLGQRVLGTDQGEYSLLDVRTLDLDVSEDESGTDAEAPVEG